jgi:hypothetical protein
MLLEQSAGHREEEALLATLDSALGEPLIGVGGGAQQPLVAVDEDQRQVRRDLDVADGLLGPRQLVPAGPIDPLDLGTLLGLLGGRLLLAGRSARP